MRYSQAHASRAARCSCCCCCASHQPSQTHALQHAVAVVGRHAAQLHGGANAEQHRGELQAPGGQRDGRHIAHHCKHNGCRRHGEDLRCTGGWHGSTAVGWCRTHKPVAAAASWHERRQAGGGGGGLTAATSSAHVHIGGLWCCSSSSSCPGSSSSHSCSKAPMRGAARGTASSSCRSDGLMAEIPWPIAIERAHRAVHRGTATAASVPCKLCAFCRA